MTAVGLEQFTFSERLDKQTLAADRSKAKIEAYENRTVEVQNSRYWATPFPKGAAWL